MAQALEAKLPESTFDPRQNTDLAETIAYLMLLKEKGLDNGYRVGITIKEFRSTLIDSSCSYCSGEAVVIRDSESKHGTLVVGRLLFDDSAYSRKRLFQQSLKPATPVDQVPKDYVREVK